MASFGGITKWHRGAQAPAEDAPPRDGIWLFERTVQALALFTLAAIAAVLIVGCGPSDVEVTAALVAAADERKANVGPEDRAAVIHLSHPLGYAATVRDCLPSGRACTEVRYYFSKAAQ